LLQRWGDFKFGIWDLGFETRMWCFSFWKVIAEHEYFDQ
jgi:hypothetical protein